MSQTSTDCPECGAEDSLRTSSVMKWGKVNKWVHVPMCIACNFIGKADMTLSVKFIGKAK